MSPSVSLFALSLLTLGKITTAVPVKRADFSNVGADCDSSVEQYMQIEMYDYHDNPKVTMTWRQVTGECGAAVSNPAEFTEIYDSSAGDSLPDDDGRVKLELFVCAPFGEYELELVIESTSAAGSTLEQRTSWEIEWGETEFPLWDTVDTVLNSDTDYSPKVPGTYTWPLAGSTGYYSTLYAGPLPPILCPSSVPANTVYSGCYEDSSSSRTFGGGQLNLPGKETPSGMTPQACSDFCDGYDYFGLEFSYQCFCGTTSEFASATPSSNCGADYDDLCSGDSVATCGGFNALSVYERTVTPPTPAPSAITSPTPAPSAITPPTPAPSAITPPTPAPSAITPPTPAPSAITPPTPAPSAITPPTPAPAQPTSSSYTYEGCFVDDKLNRIMSEKVTQQPMSAEICFGICNDGVSNYFGTQFGKECWCGVDTDLTANGEEAATSECDMACSGTTTDEKCGGRDRMSAYKMEGDLDATYVGCYADKSNARAMPAAGKYISSSMTNEVCWDRCSELGYAYAGTQYGVECWCDDSFIDHGEVDRCTVTCGGDDSEFCGGFFALDIYML